MTGREPLGREVSEQIRFGLDRLRSRNGFHEFEALCLDFANASLGGHFVPSTGPVGAGGDYGRDFTSYQRLVHENGDAVFAGEIVGICTIQADRVVAKIRADLRRLTEHRPVAGVFAFLAADLASGRIEELKREAVRDYGISLEIFDGHRLSTVMATQNFAGIAFRRLHLDQRSLSAAARATNDARQWAEKVDGSLRPEFHDYLLAIREACRRHPWSFVDDVPDLDELYQPLLLVGAGGSTRTWRQALERPGHVLISGPAGAGKSSILRHIAANVANRWLDQEEQPWIPVPIHAHDLALEKPLTQALREGIERRLGVLLRRPLDHDFFDREPLPARWLVLVDGLDEVREREKRQAVIKVAEYAAPTTSIQFVITSRPGGVGSDSNSFCHYALQQFDAEGVNRFVTRWLELRGRASDAAVRTKRKVTNLFVRHDWLQSPLLLVMVCALADTDSNHPSLESLYEIYSEFADRLVTGMKRSGEPVVDKLQGQIHELLEAAASYRRFQGPEARILDLVLESAAAYGITATAPLKADWPRIVQEVLLRSGLITKHGSELGFLHPSFEDYYVARSLPRCTSDEVVDALACQKESFCSDLDLVLFNLRLLELILYRVDDVDAVIADVVEAYPSAAAEVVESFGHYDVGKRTADALRAIAAAGVGLELQSHAAAALDELKPGEGVQFRLAVAGHDVGVG